MPEISGTQDMQNSENELLDGRVQHKVSLFLESWEGDFLSSSPLLSPHHMLMQQSSCNYIEGCQRENFIRSTYLCEKEIIY